MVCFCSRIRIFVRFVDASMLMTAISTLLAIWWAKLLALPACPISDSFFSSSSFAYISSHISFPLFSFLGLSLKENSCLLAFQWDWKQCARKCNPKEPLFPWRKSNKRELEAMTSLFLSLRNIMPDPTREQIHESPTNDGGLHGTCNYELQRFSCLILSWKYGEKNKFKAEDIPPVWTSSTCIAVTVASQQQFS